MKAVSTTMGRALLCSTLLALGACVGGGAPPPPDPTPMERDTYTIGVTDRLRVTVWKNPELAVEAPVRADGKISVPLLDDIQAEGLTPEELKAVLTESFSEFINNPNVTVLVVEMNSNSASVMGGVMRSGLVPLNRDMRVLDAIAAMGGFSTWAKKNQVRILRRTPQGIVEYRFNYGAYLAGKAPQSNLVLRPGDTIVVPD
ncbi:MAG: polysaccharide export protein [Proteobacteria bacterium]|nr:polysaccharide export protein [Pseudomonadota bacterium]